MTTITIESGTFNPAILMSQILVAVPSLEPLDIETPQLFVTNFESDMIGCIVTFIEPPIVEPEVQLAIDNYVHSDDTWENIREERNRLLYESDWTQIGDNPLTDQNKSDWRVYRQELRDVTDADNPNDVIWPVPPAKR